MQIQKIKLSEIKPYWRNPRINDLTVEALKRSIEKYGFNTPLVLDEDYVIITGHARYKALTQLDRKEVDCVIAKLDKKQAKEYRIADNKIAELSSWDVDALKLEVREIDGLDGLPGFSDQELQMVLEEIKFPEMPAVTPAEIERTASDLGGKFEQQSKTHETAYLDVTCPECGEDFSLDISDIERRIKVLRQEV